MSITVSALTKKYGSQYAVAALSFSVAPGEVVGFLGPNGAGKSTTMKILAGYLRPTEGTVAIAGYDPVKTPLEAKRRLGYLPEHNPLYLDLYVREYLRYAGGLQGLRGKGLAQAVEGAVERTGLGPEAHKRLAGLSKGYRQRAGLAAALLHDPEVLILDEPTSGLDPNQVVGIRALIAELGRTKALLFSSHILAEVEAVAQRVVLIHKGRLAADTTPEGLRAQAGSGSLEEAFRALTA